MIFGKESYWLGYDAQPGDEFRTNCGLKATVVTNFHTGNYNMTIEGFAYGKPQFYTIDGVWHFPNDWDADDKDSDLNIIGKWE